MSSYILIDKISKIGYTGKDRRAIAKESGISENTLKSYSKKGIYHENMKHIFCTTKIIIGNKGGLRSKMEGM